MDEKAQNNDEESTKNPPTQEVESTPPKETGENNDDVAKNDDTSNKNEPQVETEKQPDGEEETTVKKSQKLFFCNINRDSERSDIYKAFRDYGPICDILILKDKNGHSLGRGFIEFVEEADAENAKEKLNGTFVDGLKISINFATPRVRKSTDVEYKQDPDKLDEEMRRKVNRVRAKKETRNPPRPVRDYQLPQSSYERDRSKLRRSRDRYDYDYDPYDYDYKDRPIRRSRDRYSSDFSDRSAYDRYRELETERERSRSGYRSIPRSDHSELSVSYMDPSRRALSTALYSRSRYENDDYDYDRRRRYKDFDQSRLIRQPAQIAPYSYQPSFVGRSGGDIARYQDNLRFSHREIPSRDDQRGYWKDDYDQRDFRRH